MASESDLAEQLLRRNRTMTVATFNLSPNMTASNTHRLHLEPAALSDPRRYGRVVPLMIPASQVYYWERIWVVGSDRSGI
jgi:hypothetical protein